MMYTDKMIEGTVPASYRCPVNNYAHVALHNIASMCASNDGQGFITSKGLVFREHINGTYYAGDTLMYYPELVPFIRELTEYPTIERLYPFRTEQKGMAFIDELFGAIQSAYDSFERELNQAREGLNHLIQQYGTRRYVPIIDSVVKQSRGKRIVVESLTIHGVSWEVCTSHLSEDKARSALQLNIYNLLGLVHDTYDRNINNAYAFIEVVDVKLDTPFIAVRLAKTFKHAGHVVWYSLDTKQPVTKQEILRWQAPT